jgi:hypothetical protein
MELPILSVCTTAAARSSPAVHFRVFRALGRIGLGATGADRIPSNGLGKSRNNKAEESYEDRPVYPNSSNSAPNHGQRDGENALNRSEERLPDIRSSRCDVFVAAIPTVVARKLWISNIKTFSTIA